MPFTRLNIAFSVKKSNAIYQICLRIFRRFTKEEISILNQTEKEIFFADD